MVSNNKFTELTEKNDLILNKSSFVTALNRRVGDMGNKVNTLKRIS
jgi:hypothetical protein